ncbi:hypothetical protein B0H66DRAFT_113604 [Apodospora peruviana]|uniref:Uncharacterized protein n=1 Tax=Apodospora peruviana TaxID=516989 RepID=A0AAE0IHP7_9PEZI|nr:hypothetical protein B0H66DRAFT_113604 [Apodospora peruviana]
MGRNFLWLSSLLSRVQVAADRHTHLYCLRPLAGHTTDSNSRWVVTADEPVKLSETTCHETHGDVTRPLPRPPVSGHGLWKFASITLLSCVMFLFGIILAWCADGLSSRYARDDFSSGRLVFFQKKSGLRDDKSKRHCFHVNHR